MPDPTPNRGYNRPDRGSSDWHTPLNENFALIDEDVQAALESGGVGYDWIVYKDGDSWVTVQPGGSGFLDAPGPGSAIQHAVDNGNRILIADSMVATNGDSITETVTVGRALVDGGYHRIDGDANPIFDFGANAGGLHNVRIEGRTTDDQKPSNTLLRFNESGQRSVPFLKNVTLGFTFGWGAVIGGVQQTYMWGVSVDRCGRPGGGGGGLLFTDDLSGSLGSNHFQAFGLQFHGAAMGGPLIASQAINGGSTALNGMKLIGLDAENGNQSGVGGESAHIRLQDAQRPKFSHVYLRGLDPVDYAIDFDFSNGTNTLHDTVIRWDDNVTTGASIRQYRGGEVRVSDSQIHQRGGGPDAIIGDLQNASMSVVNDTTVSGGIDLISTGSGRFTAKNSNVGTLRVHATPIRISDSTVAGFVGATNRFKNVITSGGSGLPELNQQTVTDSSGIATLSWEPTGILFDREPIVNHTVRGPSVAYLDGFNTAEYNNQIYWTGVRVRCDQDLNGTPATGVPVDIAVRAIE